MMFSCCCCLREYCTFEVETMKSFDLCLSVCHNDEWLHVQYRELLNIWKKKTSKSSLILSHLQVSLFSVFVCLLFFAVNFCFIILPEKFYQFFFFVWFMAWILHYSYKFLLLIFLFSIKGEGRKSVFQKRWNSWK